MKITLKQGELIGKESKSIPNSRTYYSFLGIPYAEPPINELRFQSPVPHKGWEGVLDATKPGSPCIQKTTYISPNPFGSEDCLFVNVYVPEPIEKKRRRPVMVWIHGGGFYGGMGNLYEPDYLMEYDIIFVSFNYRLYIFGFLNLGLPECPGNVGLRDQILLFKWVRENIEAFGGDSKNVIAAGNCSGASCVHLLNISPLGKGLFDRAIMQSGTGLCPWVLANNPIKGAFELGTRLGLETNDKRELLAFLLKIPAADLLKAGRRISGEIFRGKYVSDLIFMPSVELDYKSGTAVLPQEPFILIQSAVPVPLLVGVDDNESLMQTSIDYCGIFMRYIDEENLLPKALNMPRQEIERTMQLFLDFYFNGILPHRTQSPAVLDVISDGSYGYPFYKTCENILHHHPDVPLYIYKFSYEGSLNYVKMQVELMDDIEYKGTAHGDELLYLFFIRHFRDESPPKEELPMIRRMCTLWTNFVKYGTPTPPNFEIDWKCSTSENPCYLRISKDMKLVKGVINEERMRFIDDIVLEQELYNIRLKL